MEAFVQLLNKKNRYFCKKIERPNKSVGQVSLNVNFKGLQLNQT